MRQAAEREVCEQQEHFMMEVEQALLVRRQLDEENEALRSVRRERPIDVPGAAMRVDKQPVRDYLYELSIQLDTRLRIKRSSTPELVTSASCRCGCG